MKHIKDVQKELNQIQDNDISAMRTAISRFEEWMKEGHVDETKVKELDSMIAELLIMRTKFSNNLLQWSKQGYLLDH
jgi:hypothetical protein